MHELKDATQEIHLYNDSQIRINQLGLSIINILDDMNIKTYNHSNVKITNFGRGIANNLKKKGTSDLLKTIPDDECYRIVKIEAKNRVVMAIIVFDKLIEYAYAKKQNNKVYIVVVDLATALRYEQIEFRKSPEYLTLLGDLAIDILIEKKYTSENTLEAINLITARSNKRSERLMHKGSSAKIREIFSHDEAVILIPIRRDSQLIIAKLIQHSLIGFEYVTIKNGKPRISFLSTDKVMQHEQIRFEKDHTQTKYDVTI